METLIRLGGGWQGALIAVPHDTVLLILCYGYMETLSFIICTKIELLRELQMPTCKMSLNETKSSGPSIVNIISRLSHCQVHAEERRRARRVSAASLSRWTGKCFGYPKRPPSLLGRNDDQWILFTYKKFQLTCLLAPISAGVSSLPTSLTMRVSYFEALAPNGNSHALLSPLQRSSSRRTS